ncbi:tetraspanin-1-like [Pollicipes pollicipes]|uniref:tetraspanin-1-like n=1 Tax=Pollicipes pollicipes TaxID=41117 RepID=UPI00188514B1|nr:tetraspanin-1-like [Pollicipes pollicipes]
MCAGMMCIKYVLCIFNFVFFSAGAAVLTVGIWLSVDKTSFTMLTRLSQDESLALFNDASVIEQGAYILIAAGALIFIIGFLGCCGSIKESRLMLGLYGGLMLIVFLLYIAAAILATIYKQEAEKGLKSFLQFTISEWYSTKDKPNTITVSWNVAMAQLSCCGANNYTDFRKAERWTSSKPADQVLPAACCQLIVSSDNMYQPRDPKCLTDPSADNSFYLVGCYHAIKRHVVKNVDIVIGICVALGALQLIVIILSFCLCKMIDLRSDKF